MPRIRIDLGIISQVHIRVNKQSSYINSTDHHPAEAPGVMNPRKEAGPLGTADLPAPVEIPETGIRPESLRHLL